MQPRNGNRSKSRVGHARRGQMMVIFGLTLTVFMGAMMLGVDLSRLRAEAENAQRAANAAALAGVVFLPDFPDNAAYRARQEAAKNGFTDGKNGVSVTPIQDTTFANRLKVTVTEPVSLIFGQIFGLGPRTISRSALAEYDLPLEMGSPDNVLGYAPFPTQLVSSGGTQGYYLEVRGPYGNQENGDAYSQYYESFNTAAIGTGSNQCVLCTKQWSSLINPKVSGEYSDPCNDPNPPGCATTGSGIANVGTGNVQAQLYPNLDRSNANFTGYDYVVEDPFTNTMVIKLFDPYDEGLYNHDVSTAKNISAHVAPSSKTVPGFGVQYMDAYDSNQFGNHTSTTRFSISGPGLTPDDPTMPSIGPPSAGDTTCATTNCALANNLTAGNYSWDAGDDPAYNTPHTGSWGTNIPCHSASNTASGSALSPRAACYTANQSPYAYRFLNYAIIHGPGYFRIHVSTERNSDGTFGTHGNMFGIGVCQGTDPTTNNPAHIGTAADPTANGAGTNTDPTAGETTSWNSQVCQSPNTGTACSNPGTASPGQCVHIFGLGRMCIFNNLGDGQSLIPLGYVPAEYGGKTLQIKLYDVGDSNAGHIEPLTPAGDTSHYGTNFLGGSSTSTTNLGFPVAINSTYTAAPTDPNSGYSTLGSTTLTAGDSIAVSSSSGKFNGSWLKIAVPIPANNTSGTGYSDMLNQFGGYWKMLYQVHGGNDTTTWEISVNGAPVHLVTQ